MSAPIQIASVGTAPEAAATLDLCRTELPATVDDYSSGGGSLPEQTRRACEFGKMAGKPYRLFLIWLSSPADAEGLEESVRLIRDFNLRTAAILFDASGMAPDAAESVRLFCKARSVSLQSSGEGQADPATRLWYVRYILEKDWGIDRNLIDARRRGRAMARTQRLHDAKWGVFNHYLGDSLVKTADEWNAMVDSFDVVRLADQLEACGAPYYFITLMQCKRWMCAPNATFDRTAGTKPGEACSRRDLPADIAAELARRGIDLYLYFAGEGPKGDPPYNERFGYSAPYGVGVTRPFVERWASVLEEFAVRYGGAVKGWWIDSCNREFHRYTDELLALYAQAAWKGNPDAIVAINDGVKPTYQRNAPTDDYIAGEFNDFYPVPPERFIDGAQAHALIPLAAWSEDHYTNWGRRGLKRTPEYVADYVSLVNANDGVVTIDVHVDPDGTWDPEQLEALKVVGRRTGTLK